MKKFLLICIISLILPLNIFSQVINNLVVFSNAGDKFTLILNGEKRNPFPVSRVTVTDLTLKVYKVTVIFENEKLKTHNTTLTFFGTNNECLFSLNKHGKKHTMDYVTSTPINPELVQEENQENNSNVVIDPSDNNENQNSNVVIPQNNDSYSVPSNPTTPGNTDVSIRTNKGTFGVGNNGVKVNTNGVNMEVDPNSKSVNSSVKVLGNDVSLNKSLKTGGCKGPMSTLDFNESKIQVINQTTDSTRMIEAVKISDANCLLTSQVKELMMLFKTDISKLHFAKKAYTHTSDINNYGKLEDTFISDEGKKDLRNFIKNH